MDLTDAEKAEIKAMIDAGKPLPATYRLRLFADAPETELIWKGKSSEVTAAVLPFQSIEQIDEPRARAGEYQSLFDVDHRTGRQSGGWTNKLIWDDNKLVLSSLKNGPLRREIDKAGGLKLIDIAPRSASVPISPSISRSATARRSPRSRPYDRGHAACLRSVDRPPSILSHPVGQERGDQGFAVRPRFCS